MQKYKVIFFLLLVGFSNLLLAQKITIPNPKKLEFTVSSSDSVVVFDVLTKSNPKINLKNDRRYYWYYANTILNTLGGSDGKLLHGNYTCFYINKNLREKGEFSNGLKTGEWKKWFDNGNLKELSNWKNGLQNGSYCIFNSKGELIETGNYDNNFKHGDVTTFKDLKVETIIKYRNGKIKESKIKSALAKAEKKDKIKKNNFLNNWKQKKDSNSNIKQENKEKTENLFLRIKNHLKNPKKVDNDQIIPLENR